MKEKIKESLKKHKWKILIEIIFIIISIILLTYPSTLLGEIIDMLYDIEANKNNILKSIIYLLSSCILILITRTIWKKIDFSIFLNLLKDLQDSLFTKLMKVKIKQISKIKNGEIMAYFVSDVKRVSSILTKSISTIVRLIANFVIVIIMMSKTSNIRLTIVSTLPIFITILIIILLKNKVDKSLKKAQQSFSELSEYVQESTDSIRTTKAFCGEEKQIEEFKNKNLILKNNNFQVSKTQNLLSICINLGFGLAYSFALLYGSNLVIKGEISIGDLVAFNGYLAILERPVYWIPWLIAKYKKLKVSYIRLQKMFNLSEETINLDEPSSEILKGNIEIKNLTYNYPGYIERVLENININIKRGETLGIIGVIGSGKTTLMNLLMKLYDVERGKIFIDGVDINDIPTKKIRENICYITQDNFLFSATLKENINLFKDEYKDEDIEESTKKAMIYEEISKMEEGIHTVIGEKGIDLSGGQKQRVVISRAFLNNSNIIIFDDTFSALDNKTEQNVLKNIKELTKNKTCIIISNRISDIKDCDKIIVLDQGVIVEQGTHNLLINKKGKYYNFYKNQAHKAEMSFLQ